MRIGLVGFFGNNNFGDEAILQAMIGQLKKYHEPIQIVVFTDTPEKTREKYNVITFSRKQISHLVAGINYCDIIIFTGGSLFQDETSLLNMFYYYGVAKLCRLYKKKLIFYSQGFDRLKRRISRVLLKKSIKMANRVSVRDVQSIMYLKKDLKISKEIGFVIDTALFLQPYQKDNNYKGYVGVNLMSAEGLPKIIKNLKSFQSQNNIDFIFIPFNPGDRTVYNQLKKKIDIDILEDKEPSVVMGAIKQMDMLIGQRYHSLVFSAAGRTPFIYLGNNDKGVGFAEMVKQEIISIGTKDMVKKISNVYKDREARKNVISYWMEELEKASMPEFINNLLIHYIK